MIAVIEALPALLTALAQLLGLGYLTWKLETTGAANKIVGGVGDTAQGLGQIPTVAWVAGGLLVGVVLLRR